QIMPKKRKFKCPSRTSSSCSQLGLLPWGCLELLRFAMISEQMSFETEARLTSEAEESKHVTPDMCAVLQYTAEHGCMAKIGEPWLGPARLLERQGLIVLHRCLAGHYAARLTPDGAELLSIWRAASRQA